MHRKSLVLLILGVIAIVFYRMAGLDFDWSLFLASLWKVQLGWFIISMLITFATYVSRAFRWQILLNPLKPIRIGPLFSTNLLGFTGIFFLGRAGEVIRLGVTGYPRFADVQARMSDNSDGDAVIYFGNGNMITVVGVSSTSLTSDDFMFT